MTLNPFLNDDTSLLQLRCVSQSHTLVGHFLAGKCSHEVVGTTGAGGVGAVDKVVDVADGVGCVEARLQSAAVAEADLERNDWGRFIDGDGWLCGGGRG